MSFGESGNPGHRGATSLDGLSINKVAEVGHDKPIFLVLLTHKFIIYNNLQNR
jgi:hypothetical protein